MRCKKCGKEMEYYEERGLYGYGCVPCLKAEYVLLEDATTEELLQELRRREGLLGMAIYVLRESKIDFQYDDIEQEENSLGIIETNTGNMFWLYFPKDGNLTK